jgi:LysM repeat protein
MSHLKRKIPILVILTAFLFGLLQTSLPGHFTHGIAQAAPQAQVPIYTPTPGPDGKIIWIVKSNDTLLSISLISGVPVDNLRQLNNLTSDTIIVGQKLIIGLAGPALVTPTLGPTPTPTPILPTPSPRPGNGNLCILLFNDINGDSLRQESEPSIPGGAISINNRVGSVSLTADSDSGSDYQCFQDLPEGDYTISVAVPQGYNATTNNNYALALMAGDQTYIDFGAQPNSQTLAQAPVLPAEGERSPLLGIIGVVFLLVGAGAAIFAARMMRTK